MWNGRSIDNAALIAVVEEARESVRAVTPERAAMQHASNLPAAVVVPAKLAALSEIATPGNWHWWTSCSWLRLGTDARGHDRSGAPYSQDGYVAYPYVEAAPVWWSVHGLA